MSDSKLRSEVAKVSSDRWERSPLLAQDMDRLTAELSLTIERDTDVAFLHWDVPETLEIQETSAWEVERSGSPAGPFRVLGNPLPHDARSFRDDDVPAGMEHTRFLYYRLALVDVESRRVFGYNPAYDSTSSNNAVWGKPWGPRGVRTDYAPGEVRQMRQLLQMMMRKRASIRAFMYRPAWAEGPCPACKDSSTGTDWSGPGGGTCRTCLGSGFSTGYYSPMETVIVPQDSQLHVQQNPISRTDRIDATQVLMPHWPLPHEGDLIRQEDGTLWRINNTMTGDMYGHPTLILAALTQMNRNHPLSSLPFPAPTDSTKPGPKVQYGRAMSLDAYANAKG